MIRKKRPCYDSSDDEQALIANETTSKNSLLRDILSTNKILHDSSKIMPESIGSSSLDADLIWKRKKTRPFYDSDSSEDDIRSTAKQANMSSISKSTIGYDVKTAGHMKIDTLSYDASTPTVGDNLQIKNRQGSKSSNSNMNKFGKSLGSPLSKSAFNYRMQPSFRGDFELYPKFENLEEKREASPVLLPATQNHSFVPIKATSPIEKVSNIQSGEILRLNIVSKREKDMIPVLQSSIPASVARYIFDYQIFSIKWLWKKVKRQNK